MRLTNVSNKPHAHRCTCGETWAHDPEMLQAKCGGNPIRGMIAHELAHTCPKCGKHAFAVLQARKAENCVVWDGLEKPHDPKDREISEVQKYESTDSN